MTRGGDKVAPFWRGGIQFECQQSGRCCTSRGEYGFVYLTEVDRRRLAAHLEMPPATFRSRYCAKTEEHWHLRDPAADCPFLVDHRCGVYDARPEQCRTWPFWPENLTNARVWRREVASFCPGVGQGRLYSGDEITAILAAQESADDE